MVLDWCPGGLALDAAYQHAQQIKATEQAEEITVEQVGVVVPDLAAEVERVQVRLR